MILGFTGSRWGMSHAQLAALAGVMTEDWEEVHHGDCVGADAECHALAEAVALRTVVHPPSDERLRAFCPGDVVLPPASYVVRDRAIVAACDVLVACPREAVAVPRSGTWLTINLGRAAHRPVRIVFPDGTFSTERLSHL